MLSVICLPLAGNHAAGIYDPDHHELVAPAPADLDASLRANRESVSEICGVAMGTTLQFAADIERAEAAYEHSGTLVWRDAGALLVVIALIADALGLAATPLGRIGGTVVRAAGLLEPRWRAAGAVHIASRRSAMPE